MKSTTDIAQEILDALAQRPAEVGALFSPVGNDRERGVRELVQLIEPILKGMGDHHEPEPRGHNFRDGDLEVLDAGDREKVCALANRDRLEAAIGVLRSLQDDHLDYIKWIKKAFPPSKYNTSRDEGLTVSFHQRCIDDYEATINAIIELRQGADND